MQSFEQNLLNLYGPQGQEWLKGLPALIDKLARQWDLQNIEPFTNLSWNYVAKADSKKYGPVCLKVGLDLAPLKKEALALKTFQGQGIVTLLEIDEKTHALLLEQAIPGLSLKEVPLSWEEKIEVYAKAIHPLHQGKCLGNNWEHVNDWLKVFDRLGEDALPDGLIKKAKDLSQKLLSQAGQNIFLHGDFHLENVISRLDEWVAIDPKGVAGPKEFDIACFDFFNPSELNTTKRTSDLFHHRLDLLSKATKTSGDVLSNWVFVRWVLGAAWMVEDNADPKIFLEKLKVF